MLFIDADQQGLKPIGSYVILIGPAEAVPFLQNVLINVPGHYPPDVNRANKTWFVSSRLRRSVLQHDRIRRAVQAE